MVVSADFQLPQVKLAPDMIHLGLGQPSSNLLPLRELETAAALCLGRDEVFFLAYGEARGNTTFRKSLAGFLTNSGKENIQGRSAPEWRRF